MSVIHRGGAKYSISFGEIKGDNRVVAVILFLNCNFLTPCDTLCIVINKKILLLVFLLVAVAITVFVFFEMSSSSVKSHTFYGSLVETGPDYLIVEGTFETESDFAAVSPKKVKIKINSDTEFIKEIWHMLSAEESAKLGGRWSPDDLEKERIAGSLDDLKNTPGSGLPIKATSKRNIYNKSSFKADTIEYLRMINPDRPDL